MNSNPWQFGGQLGTSLGAQLSTCYEQAFIVHLVFPMQLEQLVGREPQIAIFHTGDTDPSHGLTNFKPKTPERT